MIQTFFTNRLILTEMTVLDSEAVFDIYDDPVILKFYAKKPIGDKADTATFIKKITSNGNMVWNIRLQEKPEQIIGNCSLSNKNEENKTIDIDGVILPDFWGQGIMYEAFSLIIEYAKTQLAIQTFNTKTLTSNLQAIQLLEKLDFVIKETIGVETLLFRNLN